MIAIENTRLFAEVQERTQQLTQSLDDLRAAQDSLVQTEKLAALGRLVAGVAHEINTPIGTSLTVASTLIEKTDRFEAVVAAGDVRRSNLTEFIGASREAASQVMINLNHAIDLIQSFKQVAADRNISDRRAFDLGDVTEQVIKGLRFSLRRDLSVQVECADDLAMNSYPGPYGQVITNLVLNSAVHAFPDGETRLRAYCGAGVGQEQCRSAVLRRRLRHEPGGPAPGVRPVLHHKARPGQHRARTAHRPQHRHQPPRWPDLSGHQTRRRHENPHRDAARGAAGACRGMMCED